MLITFKIKHSVVVIGICMTALLGSCVSTSDEPASADIRSEMRFGVKSENSRAVVDDATFATDGTAFDVWGSFGENNDSPSQSIILTKEAVVRSEGDWKYVHLQYWLPKFAYNFQAIYPSSVSSDVKFEAATRRLTVENFDSSKSVDLMAASVSVDAATTATYEDPAVTPAPVDLRFSHLLSRVTFRGYSDEKLLGTGRRIVVTKIAVGGFASKGDVTVDGATGTATWTADAIDSNPVKTISSETGIFLEYAGTDLFDGDAALLVIPQQIPDGAYVEITYKYNMGADYTHTARASLNSGGVTKWEAGKSYRYPFTFNEGIFWDLPTVDAWIDSPINGRPGFNIDIDNNSI